MVTSPRPENEAQRLKKLHALGIMNFDSEPGFDNLTELASLLLHKPIALITILDENRQLFKSAHGIKIRETPRQYAFCGHAILNPDEIFEVPDASKDSKFSDNPLVLGDPFIKYYAGVPIKDSEGFVFGTICVIDTIPNKLTKVEIEILKTLAHQVEILLEHREKNIASDFLESDFKSLFELVTDGVLLLDDTGKIQAANPVACYLLRQKKEGLIGKEIRKLDMSFIDSNETPLSWSEHPIQKVLDGEQEIWEEMIGIQRQQQIYWNIWTINPIQTPASGTTAIKKFICLISEVNVEQEIHDSLQQSEKKYRELTDGLEHAMFTCSPDGDLTFINSYGLDFIGLKEDTNFETINLKEYLHPDDLMGFQLLKVRCLKNGIEFNQDLRFQHHTGTYYWFNINCHPIFSDEGELTQWNGLGTNIDEKYRIQKEILYNEKKYRMIAEISEDIIELYEDGVMTFVNPAVTKILGYKPDTYLTLDRESLIHPEDLATYQLYMTQVIKPDLSIKERFEYRSRHTKGSYVWLESIATCEKHDLGHWITVTTSRDITANKQRSISLGAKNDHYEFLIENTPIPMVVMTADEILYANPMAVGFFQMGSLNELIGLNPLKLVHPDYHKEANQRLDKFKKEHALLAPSYSGQVITKKGQVIDVLSSSIAVNYEGQAAMCIMFSDITSLKLTQSQLENQAVMMNQTIEKLSESVSHKDYLLKEVHHRVKNNLQLILNFIHLQSSNTDSEDIKAYSKDLTNRIFSVSYIHEMLLKDDKIEHIQIATYLRNIVEAVISSSPIQPRLYLDIEPLKEVADVSLNCGMIVYEVVSNCLKYAFTPEHIAPSISISYKRFGRNKRKLKISDNGKGFEHNLQKSQQTSLGLVLVDVLSKQINGKYQFYNNKGATFELQITMESPHK